MSRPLTFVDLGDPRVAAELRQLADGADRMAEALAQAEAAARQHAATLRDFERHAASRPVPAVAVTLVVDMLDRDDVEEVDASDAFVRH